MGHGYDSKCSKKSTLFGEILTTAATNVKEREWRSFLYNCDFARIYHTPEWKTFLESTFGYESHYLFSKDENGKIDGFLPLFYVKSKLTGNRLCSVPFSHICGYVGLDSSERKLLDEGVNLCLRLNANYFEVRSPVGTIGFQSRNSFSTHVLELCPETDDTWFKLERKSVRWAIKKSKMMGVKVESTNNLEDIKAFYELNCITKKEIGVPCHPWKFFSNMFKFLNKYVSLYIARYDDEIIAGGVFEYFNREVLYGYGAAHPDYQKFYPYNAFIWKSIEDACLNGYKRFDFGRTSYDNRGLMNFKKRWGTNETRLYYSFYPEAPMSLTENRDNPKYKYGIKLVKQLPLPLYKKLGDLVFGYFG